MREKENIVSIQETALRLQKIRRNARMTQEEFAEELDISVSAYKKLKRAERQISVDVLRRMEQKFRVSADYILFGEQENLDKVWEALLNCSEQDKMFLLLRLMDYFTRVKERQYLTQDMQSIYDEKLLRILKEMDTQDKNDKKYFNTGR